MIRSERKSNDSMANNKAVTDDNTEQFNYADEKLIKTENSNSFTSKRTSANHNYLRLVVFGLVLWFFFGYSSADFLPYSNVDKSPSLNLSSAFSGITPSLSNKTVSEIIGVGFPDIPNPSYGESVYESTLLLSVFGNTWGKATTVDYTPPDVEFNKVVLTLNVEVDGIQFDRLINIFIGGAQIWRSSTIEPGNAPVQSSTKKDVSDYLVLFNQSNEILVELGNIVNEQYTGEFNVKLIANYYNDESDSELVDALTSSGSKNPILTRFNAANHVFPLIQKSDPSKAPVNYLPADRFSVNLPEVSVKTSKLKLAIFASGNSQEEFWYSNVLEKYRNKYGNDTLAGHGPVRIVNVYFNGEKISVQSPNPVVYTGGISPAFWRSVVSISAFDNRAIELDVSGLLPVLWESQSIQDRILEIEVSNGLSETGDSDKKIGDNWITSANLLTYENEDIESVEGKIVGVYPNQWSNVVSVAPPYTSTLTQNIDAHFNSSLVSDVSFTLKNGKTYNSTIYLNTSASANNVQTYTNSGENSNVVYTGENFKTFIVIDENDKVHKLSTSTTYPVTLTITENDKDTDPDNYVIDYEADIILGRVVRVAKNTDEMILNMGEYQNGTSNYVLSAHGNHGSGALDTKYTLQGFKNNKQFHYYNRVVTSENGKILSDVVEEE